HLRQQFALGRATMSPSRWIRDSQNIGRKLPLLITVLLSIAVTLIAGSAYREMKRTVVGAASDHLSTVSRQIASIFVESEARFRREGTPLSRDTTLRAALLHPTAATQAAARAKLEQRAQTAPMFAAELWDTHGTRVLASSKIAGETPAMLPSKSAIAPLLAR